MTKVLLDTSALLALINEETGADEVIKILPNAIMSSVNVAETVFFLGSKYKMPIEDIKNLVQKLIEHVIDFSAEHAYVASKLNEHANLGLSLGDRACLATAIDMDIPVYTADSAWGKLDLNGLDVHLVR